MKFLRFIFPLLAVASLVACGGAGPETRAIMNAPGALKVDRTATDKSFVLVDTGLDFATRLASYVNENNWSMPSGGGASFVIGVSDVLDISIVSNNNDGFVDFAQSALTPIATTLLPRQVVAEDGTVAVPLLGRVQASGRSVQSFERLLTNRLSEVLVNPTAIVQMVERQSATVSVIGAGINTPATYPINLSDRRLLDIIGRAGGPSGEASDTIVTLSRSSRTYKAVLRDVYTRKNLNPYLREGDLVSVEPRVTRIQVLGATGTNSMVEISGVDATLIDVLSESGGFISPRADLKGVFVYRQASWDELSKIGTDLSAFTGEQRIPTIYRFDMTDPTAPFTTRAFRMQDDDILYVADSANAKLSNFFGATGNLAPNPAVYVEDATLGN